MAGSPNQYQLLDFGSPGGAGESRKLERFGALVLDRPAPQAAPRTAAHAELWRSAAARYVLDDADRRGPRRGHWAPVDAVAQPWPIELDVSGLAQPLRLELKATEFGHVGLFPEQADNWAWLVERVRAAAKPVRVLNLFAYTGASTLALAAAGAAVTHVDAARGVVAWARRNAELSGLAAAPVRWICEDALKFTQRELKRGRRYDAVVLDPPSYGHGPQGQDWVLERDATELLRGCGALLSDGGQFALLTAHTGGLTPEDLMSMLGAAATGGQMIGGEMLLRTALGESLPAGLMARWQNE